MQTRDEKLAAAAQKLRDLWRDSGACASYSERLEASEKCAACHRGRIAHQLLVLADHIDRILLGRV